MNRNEMSLEIESDPRNESFARVVVASFMTRINPTLEEVADVKTAVSEAVTNAIVHGYDEGEGRIIIKAVTDVEERTLEVWITDCGKGIEDIKKAMEPCSIINTILFLFPINIHHYNILCRIPIIVQTTTNPIIKETSIDIITWSFRAS